MAGLSKALFADGALVRPCALVCQEVCLQVARLLEELPTMWAGMGFYAIVTQDMRYKVIFGRVGLFAHAALPALQAFANIYAIGLVDLNVDVQSVNAASPRCLPFHRLPPEQALVALIKLPYAIHIPTLIANLICTKVAADLFPSTARLPHPCLIHFLLHVLVSSFLQCTVSVMRMNLIRCVSVGVGMNMVVRWWMSALGFPHTCRAAVVGVRFGGQAVTRVVYHLHALSRHHAHHVVAGR